MRIADRRIDTDTEICIGQTSFTIHDGLDVGPAIR